MPLCTCLTPEFHCFRISSFHRDPMLLSWKHSPDLTCLGEVDPSLLFKLTSQGGPSLVEGLSQIQLPLAQRFSQEPSASQEQQYGILLALPRAKGGMMFQHQPAGGSAEIQTRPFFSKGNLP
uniref:Uncharacterized protein n=1 Tax=Pipistrellus kuhlii TaxID=59472 RepID=A0A7J7Y981_PIPKU|nr:hypothetical protein mPipKuh1_010337 [Pipistrellus kuhlii]